MADATRLRPAEATTVLPARADSGRLTGYLIVCIIPAAFWTSVLSLTCWYFDLETTSPMLLGSFLTIAAFLAIIFSALSSGRERED